MPGVLLTDGYTGDRAGISAAANWADDHWTLVASRKIATGSKYDVDFLPGNTVLSLRLSLRPYADAPHSAHAAGRSPPALTGTAGMAGPVTLVINGRRITAKAGQTLLDAGLAGGRVIPHDCATGQCDTCRVRIHSGTVDDAGTRIGDTVLACRARLTARDGDRIR